MAVPSTFVTGGFHAQNHLPRGRVCVFATVSARADDRSAKWVGRWTFYTQYTATPETLTLKETGGKMTGDLNARPLGIAIFKAMRCA